MALSLISSIFLLFIYFSDWPLIELLIISLLIVWLNIALGEFELAPPCPSKNYFYISAPYCLGDFFLPFGGPTFMFIIVIGFLFGCSYYYCYCSEGITPDYSLLLSISYVESSTTRLFVELGWTVADGDSTWSLGMVGGFFRLLLAKEVFLFLSWVRDWGDFRVGAGGLGSWRSMKTILFSILLANSGGRKTRV